MASTPDDESTPPRRPADRAFLPELECADCADAGPFSVEYRIMEYTIRATELARNLGDVLARVRYRRDAFVIERNGIRVARVVPMPAPVAATTGDALAAWLEGADADPGFVDDLAAINAADRPPAVRWGS